MSLGQQVAILGAHTDGAKINQINQRSDTLSVQSLCHHFSVHDRDVNEEEDDDEEIVHEAQQTEKGLGHEVERRRQVGEGPDQAEEDPDPEHPEQPAHGEHLPEEVTQ